MRDEREAARTRPSEDNIATAPDAHAAQTRLSAADHDPAEAAAAERIKKLAAQSNTLKRYEVTGEAGRGGMGAVLKVFDADLRRTLAMKIILDRAAGPSGDSEVAPDVLARFLEEAQVTGQLDHPGVVPVHELGVDAEGRAYFTMPLVNGRELSAVIEEVHGGGQWTMTRALGVMLKVCEAMSYAHDRGVVHRDLKPANVMVGEYGEVYVMDWGLARLLDAGQDCPQHIANQIESVPRRVRTDRRDAASTAPTAVQLTMDGSVMGTPCYMAPEQAMGRIHEIGPAADVYAVGAMLYHLLTGRMPYVDGDERVSATEVVERVRSGAPKAVQQLAPGTAQELVAICERAMQRDAGERYRDMGALAADLRAFLENRVVQAHRTGAIAELRKWMQRNRALATTLLLFVMVVVGGSIASASIWRDQRDRAVEAEGQAKLQTDLARKAGEQAVIERDTARHRLVLSHSQRGANLLADGDASGAAIWFAEALRGSEGLPQLADLQRRRLRAELAGAPELLSVADTDLPARGQLSADGKRLLTMDRDGCVLWDAEQGRRLLSMPEARGWFSPTGKYIALLTHLEAPDRDGELPRTLLALADSNSGQALADQFEVTGEASFLGFAGDGPGFFVGLDVSAGEPAMPLLYWNALDAGSAPDESLLLGGWQSLRLTPDGRIAVVAGKAYQRDRALTVFEPLAGRLLHHIEHPAEVENVVLADDGKTVVTSWGTCARVWNTATGAVCSRLLEHGQPIVYLRYAPAAAIVVTVSVDAAADAAVNRPYLVRIWDVRDGAAAAPVELEHQGAIQAVELTRDGRRLISLTTQHPTATHPNRTDCHLACAIDTRTGELTSIGRVRCRGDERLASRGLLADGRLLTTHESRGAFAATTWDPAQPDFDPTTFSFGDLVGKASFDAAAGRVAIGPTGDMLSTDRDCTVQVIDLHSAKPRTLAFAAQAGLQAVAIRPDASRVAAIDGNGAIQRLDMAKGLAIEPALQIEGRRVTCLAYSPDGTRLLVGTADGSVQFFDGETGKPTGPGLSLDYPIDAVAFSQDGTRAWAHTNMGGDAGSSVGNAHVIDVASQTVRCARAAITTGICFDASGQYLLALRTEQWTVVSILGDEASDSIWSSGYDDNHFDTGCFDSDGQRIAVAKRNGTAAQIQLHDTATGEPVGRTMLHGGPVTRLAFARDGKLLASASEDGTARLWDAHTGLAATPPLQHGAPVVRLRFHPDGNLLATLDTNGDAHVWSAGTGERVLPAQQPYDASRGRVAATDVAFLPGSDRLLLLLSGGAPPRVLDVAPDPRPVDQLVLAATLHGHRAVNTMGRLSDLTTPETIERLERWMRLRQAGR